MSLHLSEQQIKDTVEFIKDSVRLNGNCRVGYALKEVIGPEYEKSFHNIEKVARIATATNEYKLSHSLEFPKDFCVFKNPSYKKERWTERNPMAFEFAKGGIIVVASVLASILTSIITTNNVMKEKY